MVWWTDLGSVCRVKCGGVGDHLQPLHICACYTLAPSVDSTHTRRLREEHSGFGALEVLPDW